MPKPNPFIDTEEALRASAKAEGAAKAAANVDAATKPKRRSPRKPKDPDLAAVQEFCDRLASGDLDRHVVLISEALEGRKEVLKERLLEQVRAVWGDDAIVTKPGQSIAGARIAAGGSHPNEVDLSPGAADGLPDLSTGYGSPSIVGEGGSAVTAAPDPMGVADTVATAGEIISTGAQIG